MLTCAGPEVKFSSSKGLGAEMQLTQLEPSMMPESGGQ